MAGDWIKMRIDLQTHPKVVRILSATESDKFRVIGGLHSVWSVFDTHTQDGILKGYTAKTLDHIIGWEGFAEALMCVDWLIETTEGLVMPEFFEHNGKSGKRRAEDQKRKRESRKCPQSVRNLSATEQDKKLTREEKRRDKENNKKKTFSIPSQEEIKAYCLERKNSVDPNKFYDFYQSKGWMVGKNKMKDWKAAIRTWEKENRTTAISRQPSETGQRVVPDASETQKYLRELYGD